MIAAVVVILRKEERAQAADAHRSTQTLRPMCTLFRFRLRGLLIEVDALGLKSKQLSSGEPVTGDAEQDEADSIASTRAVNFSIVSSKCLAELDSLASSAEKARSR